MQALPCHRCCIKPETCLQTKIRNYGQYVGGCKGTGLAMIRKNKFRSRATPVCQLSINPEFTQTILLGGFIIAALGFSFVNGLKKNPEMCTSCGGRGGVKCFGCDGTGTMNLDDVELSSLDFISKPDRKNRCRVCKGCGMVFCRRCRGSGYLNM